MYSDVEFQAFALDLWDGTDEQVQFFIDQTEVTYPVLMDAGLANINEDYTTGISYFFVIDANGMIHWRGHWIQNQIIDAIDEALASATSVSPDTTPVAAVFNLAANYPNPFNPNTNIPYELADPNQDVAVRLEIIDPLGRLVQTLVAANQTGGQSYEVQWNGSDRFGKAMPSGIYFSRLTCDGKVQSQMMTLLR